MLTKPHPNDLRDLYIKLNPNGWCDEDLEKDSLGFVDPHTSQDFNAFRAGHQVGHEDNERLTAERNALQQRLNAVEEENDRLRHNDRRYRLLRDRMTVEDFPAEHPEWSTPSEHESVRIDRLCDAALREQGTGQSTAEALADVVDHAKWLENRS